jgi:hypothetical protein
MKTARILALLLLAASLAATPAWAETCQYETRWGVLTITYNADETVVGSYPYHNGTITGVVANGVVQGQWRQDDSRGAYVFRLNNRGFTGKWNYAGDSRWQGNWNGDLLKCFE